MLPLQRVFRIGILVFAVIIFQSSALFSQNQSVLNGRVLNKSTGLPIENAVLLVLPSGKSTFSDSSGKFSLIFSNNWTQLLISASGYKRDTLSHSNKDFQEIRLEEIEKRGKEILVLEERNPGQTGFKSASLQINIDRKELRKAACCNLSESFETSPLVDVSFPDPVSGARQIQMLGLAGQYTGYSQENQSNPPGVLGPGATALVPGPWLESIQVQKGIGTLASGYGGLAGQINTNFLKADTASKIELNGFGSSMRRFEGNLFLPIRKSTSGGTALFFHANTSIMNHDENGDGYRDFPIGKQVNAMLRSYHNFARNISMQISASVFRDERLGGSMNYESGLPKNFEGFAYKSEMEGLGLAGKIGKVFNTEMYSSLGVLWSGGIRKNNTGAGKNQIALQEKYFSLEPVFQADLNRNGAGIKIGLSLSGRNREESLVQFQYNQEFDFNIHEIRTGGFAEISLPLSPELLMVAGSRLDFHNLYGLRASPRVHLRYETPSGIVLRLAAGIAWQDPEILAQNLSYFSSGRKIEFQGIESNLPFGLKSERGSGIGLSASQNYRILIGKGSITADVFLSEIRNQSITDAENSGVLRFYTSSGKAESISAAIQADQKLGRFFSVRLAYRYSNALSDYTSGKLSRPMLAFNRAFVHLDFEPGREFRINGTLQLTGSKRLYGSIESSPVFLTINMQVSKKWTDKFELYLGAENLGNFTQTTLVLNSGAIGSPSFDAAQIWGPSIGIMVYAGFRIAF